MKNERVLFKPDVPDVLLFTEGHGEPLEAGGGIERTKKDEFQAGRAVLPRPGWLLKDSLRS